ncbi:MAG: hypothetical protein AAF517_04380 [Planctomycetota bacterium]
MTRALLHRQIVAAIPLTFVFLCAARAETRITLVNGSPAVEDEAVLLAIDDTSLPGSRAVERRLTRPTKHAQNPILSRGTQGPGAYRVSSPVVLREGSKWRMWYASLADAKWHEGRVAYAESENGVNWRQPKLRKVAFRGSRENNFVAAAPGLCATLSVLYDPKAPPDRRFVMTGEDLRYWQLSGGWSLAKNSSVTRIDTSADGIHWNSVREGPGLIQQQHEAHTIYRFGGLYHLGGHQISPLLRLPEQAHGLGLYLGPRTFVVWRSPRLDRWPVEHTKAFFKPMRSSSPYRKRWDREEVHLGAAVTVRANLCIGVYGQWHHPIGEGAPKYSGKDVSCDLGLIVSHDGLHFREPAPGSTWIRRDQELRWDRDFQQNLTEDNLILHQGSIVTTESETRIYYSATTPGGNVGAVKSNIGLATLPRDRFGYLSKIPGNSGDGQVVSCPVRVDGSANVVVNSAVPKGSALEVELLDEHGLDVLDDYTARPVRSGLDETVGWNNTLVPQGTRFRIRVRLRGAAKLYALYLRAPAKERPSE